MESATEPESGPARTFPSGSPEPSLPRADPLEALSDNKGPFPLRKRESSGSSSHSVAQPRVGPAAYPPSCPPVWPHELRPMEEEEEEFGDVSPSVWRAFCFCLLLRSRNTAWTSPHFLSVSLSEPGLGSGLGACGVIPSLLPASPIVSP